MKRLWVGLGLLLLLLAAGICSTLVMEDFHHSLSRRLASTAAAASEEDWDQAALLLQQCRSRWVRYRNFIATGASHESIEEIDSLYTQLTIYFHRQDSLGFSLCCTALQHRTAALGEAQSINWWNLL